MHNKRTVSYEDLGVSSQKEDVHNALGNIDQGLFPNAFCKIIPDIANDPAYCSLVHADGAGTKSILAYMMYKETNDLKYFKGIVQDSIVMNVDDVLCVGANSQFLLSNTIGRNKKLISGDMISTIIQHYENYIKELQKMNLPINTCGGETADVGDVVRTLIVDSTLVARMKRKDVIDPINIENNDVIVGLSSYGSSSYENMEYNSGIGSNGLTLARHGVLHHEYYAKYPECFNPQINKDIIFFGNYSLLDKVPNTPLSVGEALLSPTRTYTPILLDLFKEEHKLIHAIFHNTGGGQTKCLKFGEKNHYIKDNLFEVPPIFKLIQDSSQTSWKEMYSVFNMGHRMEIICPESYAKDKIIPIANKYNVGAKIIGKVEKINTTRANQLTISDSHVNITY